MATSTIQKDILFVAATGIGKTLAGYSTDVFDTDIDIQTYTSMGYKYQGFMPSSTGDFITYGSRLSGTKVRLTVTNQYNGTQTLTIGGVAVFSK